MRPSLLIVILMASHSGHADNVSVDRRQNSIVMRGVKCEDASVEIQALKRWVDQVPDSRCETKTTVSVGEQCEVDITGCVPSHVRQYHGVLPEMQGPNCWNFVMAFKEVQGAFRSATADEYLNFLASGLCRKLGPGEELIPGDVGSFEDSICLARHEINDCPMHGFIHVSSKLVYAKNDPFYRSPFALQSREKMMAQYGKLLERRCATVDFENGGQAGTEVFHETCRIREKPLVEYYRCKSMSSYLAEHPVLMDAERKEADSQIRAMECYIPSPIRSGFPRLSCGLRPCSQFRGPARPHLCVNDCFENQFQLRRPSIIS